MKYIAYRYIGETMVWDLFKADYNTYNFAEEELEEMCRLWKKEDREEHGLETDYWLEEEDA